ncbi:MAG: Na+/H+ antiporter [Mycobacteriales bacterium]
MSVEVAAAVTLLAVALVGAGALLSRRTGVPAPVLLAVAGLVYAELPGPNVRLDPKIALYLVIPPLLYSSALQASIIEIRRLRREVGLLSIGLPLVTAIGIGYALYAVVPGLPLSVGVALGAAVAPNDPISALAIARRVGLSRHLVSVVEGESLFNDASALTTYTVAVAAVGGDFSAGGTAGRLVLAVGGGLVIGAAVGWVGGQIATRLTDPTLQSVLSLALPFASFLPAEKLHASGVLSVVVCGLLLGHQSPDILTGPARLQGRSVWRVVDLLLEGVVFILIGVQMPHIVDGLRNEDVGVIAAASAVTVAIVLLGRPLWFAVTMQLPAMLAGARRQRGFSGAELTALSWAGMRGVVTMAAAFALPIVTGGRAFPSRDLMIFLAFLVVFVTLVGQGLTFTPLLRRLDLRENAAARQQAIADSRRAAIEAGVRRLEEVRDERLAPVVERLRAQSLDRAEVVRDRLAAAGMGGSEDDGAGERAALARAAATLRLRMIDAERRALLARREDGDLDDAGLRALLRELDHEERALAVRLEVPHP